MPTSHFKAVDGVRTHYLDIGSGEPLLLIHGGGAGADSRGNWSACISLFAEKFRVIAMDMVGFGQSDKPSPDDYEYSQSKRNQHLIAFVEALGLESVNVIGNSMGGSTALGLAMERPDMVRKLVLMGAAGLPIFHEDPKVLQSMNYDFTVDGMKRLMANLTGPGFVIEDELVQYRYEIANENPDAVAAINQSKMYYTEEEVSVVKTPTLVVGGKEDKICVLKRTYKFLELLENSYGFILPHCGHWVMMEAPNEFVAVTSQFFAEGVFGGVNHAG